ncbi:hypothetical protein MG293_016091 [Ovis ammon polii]|uniref:Uncharacterized protein n=1 Tax=Ovis ammon polii TaxID=230172 RepID=A0AAD4TRS1_OVIAM|nr:hypothetical protein MG293_016091 [Ovis ammon polii]
MDPPTAGAQALGAAEQPRGLQLPSGREAPPIPGADHSNQERAPENATDRLANGAQSIPHDSPAHGEGTHCEEEGFAEDDEDSDGEPSPWELSEGMPGCLPKEQAGDLFHEDWDLELKADQGNPYVFLYNVKIILCCGEDPCRTHGRDADAVQLKIPGAHLAWNCKCSISPDFKIFVRPKDMKCCPGYGMTWIWDKRYDCWGIPRSCDRRHRVCFSGENMELMSAGSWTQSQNSNPQANVKAVLHVLVSAVITNVDTLDPQSGEEERNGMRSQVINAIPKKTERKGEVMEIGTWNMSLTLPSTVSLGAIPDIGVKPNDFVHYVLFLLIKSEYYKREKDRFGPQAGKEMSHLLGTCQVIIKDDFSQQIWPILQKSLTYVMKAAQSQRDRTYARTPSIAGDTSA